jgi:NAD(P)H-dependent flavin oxidoreductase YrpB (nitropropane dioxygenase family)
MGAGVSNWRLANAVSQVGQLGVVSGADLDHILARRLQDGDPGGHMRRALDRFLFRKMAEHIWKTFYIPGGKLENASYKTLPKHSKDSPRGLIELCIVSNLVEVSLAREGHDNPVGINYLEKIQAPHLPSIYGARLAGVAYILMGAGIPLKISGVLDLLANHQPATYELQVTAPQKKLREALAAGASGVQVGTAFAFCVESGRREDYKQGLLQKAIAGEANIFTDPSASPTGYPFKAAQLERTLSEPEVYNARPRICDLGYLREAYRTPEGAIEYRCAGEPVSVYVSKGGQEEATVGRNACAMRCWPNRNAASSRRQV